MLITLTIVAALFGVLMLLRPGNTGAGSMSQRWLEDERASHSD